MTLDWLYWPSEQLDGWLTAGLDGAGLIVVLMLAVLLGLRHATDPDHLVAVTALATGPHGSVGQATRLGAWWGAGHAATLLTVGVPLVVLDGRLPGALERAAETLVGLMIMALAARMLMGWWRVRVGAAAPLPVAPDRRAPAQAASIGIAHGLGGTGAISLLFAHHLPSVGQAAGALLIFASMSVVSMASCTHLYARLVLARPAMPRGLVPALGVLGLVFGAWYVAAA